jgi:aminoglycoside phosphotransferase (APT) family kinase protein
MKQLTARLGAIHRVHPAFRRPERRIDDLHIPSSDDLIDRCTRIEAALKAPFSIFIHGDFNVNNIIYSHDDQRINYIDLYRSKMADYIQDASVFLISNFRLPAFETPLRDRINRVIDHFFTFFSAFARRHDDGGFEVRMTLALARSFYTSSRFELNYAFAREMYLRSQFLMEKLVAHQGDWTTYRLPRRILFY